MISSEQRAEHNYTVAGLSKSIDNGPSSCGNTYSLVVFVTLQGCDCMH